MASAGVVNIRRDVDDKFYRYKMPNLLTKIEGKGNGIKTVLPNMTDVARALSRPPSYSTKYFGCELGAQTSMDDKNDRYIVNGAHDAARLRELLDGFIDKFVLCGECKNPETDLFLTKNDDIFRDCKACGARTGVDMRHKLTTYIIRNPPKKAKKKKTTGDSTEKENGEGEAQEGEGEGGEGSDDEFTKRIKAEAAELPTAEQVAASGLSALTLDGDDGSDEGGDSPLTALTLWVEENKGDGTTMTAKAVLDKCHELGIEGKHKTVQTLMECLFTEKILTELPRFMPIFQQYVTSEKHQKSLLGGLERFVGVHYPQLIPIVPKILMELYQKDVLEEEVITSWGTHVSKKYVERDVSKKVRKAAEPMLKWLEEADDDEEEEDEE